MPDQKTILIVDDDNQFRNYLCEYFAEHNFKVLAAINSEHAAGLLYKHRAGIDVIVSDVQVPEYKQGIWFLMLAKRYFPKILTIAMSGGSKHVNETEYFRLIELVKADYIVKKPFYSKELLQYIQKQLAA